MQQISILYEAGQLSISPRQYHKTVCETFFCITSQGTYKWWEDEEEEVSSYWIILRKREGRPTLN